MAQEEKRANADREEKRVRSAVTAAAALCWVGALGLKDRLARRVRKVNPAAAAAARTTQSELITPYPA